MAAPSLSSSNPSDGSSDVFINKPLIATFAATLKSSSIDSTSVVLLDAATDSVVATDITYSAADKQVTVTPLSVLAEDTVYKLRFPGTDVAINANYVILDDSSSDPLATTITITFTTGKKSYIDDSVVDKDATDLSLEGDIVLPVHVKALGEFALKSTTPKNHKCDVSVNLAGNNEILLKFNKIPSGALVEKDWVDVDAYPLLDDVTYLASGTSLNSGATIPSYTGLTASGHYLRVGFKGQFPKNVGVQLTLSEDITAADGSEYGPNEYILSFTTERYPSVGGVHYIKREIKAATDELNDEYICGLIFSNTVNLLERYAVATQPTYMQLKWVMYKTIIDILDDKELEKALVAGTRRQLGDLNVSVDAIIGRLSLKHARAQKELDLLDRGLAGKKAIARIYEETMLLAGGRTPDRQWYGVHGRLRNIKWKYYQGAYPGANTQANRQAKVGPHAYWWA